jgi:glycosyltransferase involved in cell wall biosynthesis
MIPMITKALFVHCGRETFVEIDREILAGFARVNDLFVPHKFPRDLTRYWQGIRNSTIVYCWFANWNSFWILLLARLFRKSSILVIGGFDVANVPVANYGNQRGGLAKVVSRMAMRLADHLVPFSDFSREEAVRGDPALIPRLSRIYLGVPDRFGSLPAGPRERMALTVGNVEWPNLKRKGLETFVRAAAALPDVQFILAGVWKDEAIDYLRSIASSNVCFTGYLSDAELIHLYKKSSVYVQASLHEGFGMSLAEAMLAGCIPVVTRAGALPEVVGDYGIICEDDSPEAVEKGIRSVLNESDMYRMQVREHIISNFPLEKRKKALASLVQVSVKPNFK